MKKKLYLGLGILAFILLIAGAGLLYNKLSSQMTPNSGLIVQNGKAERETAAETDTKSPEETETAANADSEAPAATEAVTEASSEASAETEAGSEANTEASGESELSTEAGSEIPDETEAASEATSEPPEDTEEASETESETEPPVIPAPDFTVTDMEGNELKLSDFAGTPVILNLWASWCPPCKGEMPHFEEAFKTYGDEIQFMMIDLTDGSRETVDLGKAYIEEQGYTFPVFFDTKLEAAMAYGASSIPATYFVNAKGNLEAYAVGAINAATLQTGIDMILPAP